MESGVEYPLDLLYRQVRAIHGPPFLLVLVQVNVVYFNVRYRSRRDKDEDAVKVGYGLEKDKTFASASDMFAIDEMISTVGEKVNEIRGDQSHIRHRLNRQMETAKSTYSWTFRFALLETGALVGVMALQVYMVRRMFLKNQDGGAGTYGRLGRYA